MATTEPDVETEAVPLSEIFDEGERVEGLPTFAQGIRGYDRRQVDGYIAQLLAELESARRQSEADAHAHAEVEESRLRIAQLEAELEAHEPLPKFDDLGQRISSMLAAAAEQADGLRARAKAEADSMLGRARQQGDDLVRAAEERATAVRRDADRAEADAAAGRRRRGEEAERAARDTVRNAERQVVALLADGEEQHRAVLADAAARKDEAAAEVARTLAVRDLGLEAMDRLSAVLSRTTAEARAAGPHLVGADGADGADGVDGHEGAPAAGGPEPVEPSEVDIDAGEPTQAVDLANPDVDLDSGADGRDDTGPTFERVPAAGSPGPDDVTVAGSRPRVR